MDMFTSKEQVVYFMLSTQAGLAEPNISLSHYDYKFIANLQYLTHDKKEITSNQAALFDKLISKYQRQFAKAGFDKGDLKRLPWKCDIIESLPQYTNANVDYDAVDNCLTIKVPFKKDFISQFRSMPYNQWQWQKAKKRYEAKFNTMNLKLAYDVLPNFFDTVYHGKVKTIVDELNKIKSSTKYWDPTYVKVGDGYQVAALNEVLAEKIKEDNIVMDNSPETLYKLSRLAIAISPDIYADDPKLKFASEFKTQVNISNFDDAVKWMKELGITDVILPKSTTFDQNTNKDIERILNKYDMQKFIWHTYNDFFASSEQPSSMPAIISLTDYYELPVTGAGKIIKIINQREVKL